MRLFKRITLILALAAMSAPVSFCTENDEASSSPRIAVIHSYRDAGREGEAFRDLMVKSFRKKGLHPEIDHIYMDLTRRVVGSDKSKEEDKAVAKHIGEFNPQLILINDDLAFEYMLSTHANILRKTPSVFAGVSASGFDREAFPMVCGFSDPIDLAENCRIGLEMTGWRDVAVEVDFTDIDNQLRKQMYDSISDEEEFVNNGDFHIVGQKTDPSKTTVHFLSMRNQETNHAPGEPEQKGYDNSRRIIERTTTTNVKGYVVQVKYDIFSNDLLMISDYPDVTAVREQFGELPTKFICGYFTSLETQINDQVSWAARILGGESPAYLGIAEHKKDYYLDWRAIKMMPESAISKNLYKKYKVVNAPFRTSNLPLFMILMAFLLVAVALMFIVLYRYLLHKREQKLIDEISSQWKGISDRRSLVAHNAGQAFAHAKGGNITFYFDFAKEQGLSKSVFTNKEFSEFVHKDSMDEFRYVFENIQSLPMKGRVRLQLSFNGVDWHWWTLFYAKSKSSKSKEDIIRGEVNNELTCMMVIIDNIVKQEESMNAYLLKKEEVSTKMDFISKTGGNIRTPLKAITESAGLLAKSCSSLETMQYLDVINTNLNQLVSLLNKASLTATDRLEEGQQLSISRINVSKLISNCYLTNSVLRPEEIEFRFKPTDRPDIMADVDYVRTSEMINGIVDKAFEQTESGVVTLGWEFNFKDELINVYVEAGGKKQNYHFPVAPGTPKDILI